MKLKKCEIVQQQKYLSEEKIKEGILKRNIKNYAYILHDKDVYTEEDEQINARHKAGDLKEPHWHVYLQFYDSQDTKYVAGWFGIEEQYINKSKSGHFEDMILYATHKNASQKYQYSASDVCSNFDYAKFLENNGKLETRIQEIIRKIIAGEIREYNYMNYVTPEEYVKYSPQMEKAFKYRQDLIANCNRELEVIFIVGGAGTGKTTLAKEIAKSKGYSIEFSGSDNDPFESYRGHDCFVLDDLRGSTMKFSELIKILDNNTNSLVRSRYHNKNLTECKLIIITSVYDMKDFYSNVFSESDEPLLQLQRRCKTYIKIENEDYYKSYYFDKELNKYVFSGTYKNPAKEYILKTENTKKDEHSMLEFLGAKSYIVLDLKKYNSSNNIKKEEDIPVPF